MFKSVGGNRNWCGALHAYYVTADSCASTFMHEQLRSGLERQRNETDGTLHAYIYDTELITKRLGYIINDEDQQGSRRTNFNMN